MQPSAALIERGIHALPRIGDGRQSGTSGSPSILNASPEAALRGGRFAGSALPDTVAGDPADQLDQLDQGIVLEPAVAYQRIAQSTGVPRDDH